MLLRFSPTAVGSAGEAIAVAREDELSTLPVMITGKDSESLMEDFGYRVLVHVRHELPDECCSPMKRSAWWVHECVNRAKKYGLTNEYEIVCFVDATLLLGEGFDTDPVNSWARRLLEDSGSTPPERGNELLRRATEIRDTRTRR